MTNRGFYHIIIIQEVGAYDILAILKESTLVLGVPLPRTLKCGTIIGWCVATKGVEMQNYIGWCTTTKGVEVWNDKGSVSFLFFLGDTYEF